MTSLHVHRLWISLLIEFSNKTDKRNITKKLIRYLCFIAVGFIHSCHHRLKKRNFILEKNRLRSVDLTCGRSTNHSVYHSLLVFTALNTNSWKLFWSKSKNSLSFQKSWTYSDVFQINEKFIHNCPPCLLVCQASKMLCSPPGAVNITSYKEPLDQSDCRKLFVQLWNYTNTV